MDDRDKLPYYTDVINKINGNGNIDTAYQIGKTDGCRGTGAKGKWPIMHVSMFGLGFFALAGLMFVLLPDNARWNDDVVTNAQLLLNAIVSMVVWVLIVGAYIRLREEGAEDGMTIMGKEPEADFFLMKMFPAVMVAMAIVLAAMRLM